MRSRCGRDRRGVATGRDEAARHDRARARRAARALQALGELRLRALAQHARTRVGRVRHERVGDFAGEPRHRRSDRAERDRGSRDARSARDRRTAACARSGSARRRSRAACRPASTSRSRAARRRTRAAAAPAPTTRRRSAPRRCRAPASRARVRSDRPRAPRDPTPRSAVVIGERGNASSTLVATRSVVVCSSARSDIEQAVVHGLGNVEARRSRAARRAARARRRRASGRRWSIVAKTFIGSTVAVSAARAPARDRPGSTSRIASRGPRRGGMRPALRIQRTMRPRWPRHGSSNSSMRASSPRASPVRWNATIFGRW